jgi:predicted permease
MNPFSRFMKKLSILLGRKRFLNELDEEMAYHRAQAEQEFIATGMTPDAARQAAMRQFGNVTRLREQSHQAVTFSLETLAQDARFAARQMLRAPGFAITAIVTLTLGITANLIVFGVLQALVLRPLNVPDAGKVMSLAPGGKGPNLSYQEFRDIRDGNSVFSAVAADRVMDFGLEANGATHSVWGYEVSGQYFEVVNIKPLLGRLLARPDDDHPGAAQVAVLSWAAWKNYFNGDPAIVGKTVRLNKYPYTIIGVTPQGFYGTEKFLQPDIFFPMSNEAQIENFNWLDGRQNHNVWAIVRIKDGINLAQVRADLNTVASRITKQFPKDEEGLTLKVVRPGLLGDALGAPARAFLAGIMALAGIVLLAACANLGSLFAARTADRTRELAIRMAIGSSRWRILRQVLTEAGLIAFLGGLCASALGWAALSSLGAWRPPISFPVQFAVLPQLSLLLAAAVLSLVAAGLFGIMPLRQILKTDPNDAIKSGVGLSAAGRRWALRDLLLAAQIALCCVTVTAAFVALRGLGRSLNMDLGFRPVNAVRTHFDLSQAGYSNETAASFQRRLLAAASQLPGVEAIGYANTTPLAIDQSGMAIFAPQTTEMRPANTAFWAAYYSVSPGYLAAAGTSLLAGRDISYVDGAKSPPVAIINQEFAHRLFHEDAVVGRYFKNLSGHPIQIVGIVANGKYNTLNEEPAAALFFPMEQVGNTTTSLIVRTHSDPAGATVREMEAAIRKTIHDLDPGIPVQESGAWIGQLGLQLFPAQVATVALSLFGAFGVVLSMTGTFGLASYSVSKRLRELSIRVALGAQAKQILTTALGPMLLLLGIGSTVGLGLGVAASRLLSAVVYQASAQDPFVLAAVAFTMLLTGLLSVVNPIRRALQIDPASILRDQ